MDEPRGRAYAETLLRIARERNLLNRDEPDVEGKRDDPSILWEDVKRSGRLTPEQVSEVEREAREYERTRLDSKNAVRAGISVPHESRYSIKGELARGGMGAILQVSDKAMHREVAMKVMLDPGDRDSLIRFVEEARLTGQMEHPNIVPVHDLAEDDQGNPYFTMKMVKGRSLAEVLKAIAKAQ